MYYLLNKKVKLAITFIVATVCFVACRKQEMQSAYTGTLVSKQLKITSSPKMYTQNGEVTDKVLIENYLNHLQPGNNYFFKNVDTVINPGSDSIKFITADTALIKEFNKWDKRVVKQQGEYLYLYMLDTVHYYTTPYMNPFNEVARKIGIYQPYLKINCYGTGTCIADSYDARIVKWRSDKLVLPLINYSLIHNEPNGSFYGVGRDNIITYLTLPL